MDAAYRVMGGLTETKNTYKTVRKNLIRLPQIFVEDHNERCACGCPQSEVKIIKYGYNVFYIDPKDIGLFDLYDDALHYSHEHGPDACDKSYIDSAKRVVKAIKKQMSKKWFNKYEQKNWVY
jgi:hypothetical protein